MFGPRSHNVQVVSRQARAAASVLLSLSLGFLTLNWMAGAGWRSPSDVSVARAADTPPDKGSAAAAKEAPSEQSRDIRAVGPTTFDAPVIEYFPRPTKYEAKIIAALDKPSSVEWADLGLEDCMASLKEHNKINIWIDKQTLTDEGVALDQPITLKAAGLTLRSILKLLLEPVQLTYVIENDVMKISTAGHAMSLMFTRTYPVRDLYRGRVAVNERQLDDKEPPGRTVAEARPGDLEMAITNTIERAWWVNGRPPNRHGFAADPSEEPGSITYVQEAGSLVIRQTYDAHEQILQLLRNLREAKRVGLRGGRELPVPKTGWKLHGPKRAESYSIVGVIDLDGDDNSDAGRLHELIKSIGASIDNEVDEQGVLYVDGKIPDDGRLRLTEKTKFVVVGKIPQPADLADAEEKNTSLRIAELYKEFEDQARTLGVRVIKLEEFLAYIGYERVDNNKE